MLISMVFGNFSLFDAIASCVSAVTAMPGATSISVLIGNLAPTFICTITVQVLATTPGVKLNVTGAITATNASTGNTASATITITGSLPSFQVSYFPNLNLADGVINITNPGSDGAGLAAGTTAATTRDHASSDDDQVARAETTHISKDRKSVV